MSTRSTMIGEIRDLFDFLNDAGRFEALREVMGDLDRFNLSGVDESTLRRVWRQLKTLCHGDEP